MAKKNGITISDALIPKDDYPYDVPNNWCWVKLGAISSIISKGTTPKGGKSAYVDEGIDFLRVENINDDGTICHDNMMHVTEETHTGFLKRSMLEENDVLVSIAGTLGKTAIVKKDDLPLNTNQAVAFVRLADNGEISRDFIRYAIDTPVIQNMLLAKTKVTAIPNLTLEIISDCLIPLPPLAEQKRIVEQIENLFSKLDEAKEKVQSVVDSKEFTITSLLYQAFDGKLTNSWRKANNIINVWEDTTIGELFSHSAGKALKKDNTEGTLHRYITTSNLYWGRFELTEVREMYYRDNELDKCTATKGDLLICNGGDVGRAAVWDFDYDICLQNHVSRLRKKKDNVDVRFFYYYFMLAKRKGEVNGTGIGISSLSAKSIAEMHVKLPSVEEQTAISDILDKLILEQNNACTVSENIAEQIELMKKSILAKAFRGELGTNNPEEESSIALLKEMLEKN